SVVFGGPEMPSRIELRALGRHGFRLEGIHPITRLEASAPRAADLNGDGQPDFVFSERGSPDFPSPDGVPSPGSVHVVFGLSRHVPFVRGNATFDANVDISDAIFVLSFLFLGREAPVCRDAADSDDDGQINLTDAIYLLGHLFLGGAAPPLPYPLAGLDPTADSLDCRGF
ncbi:MAG: hypothetical protein O7J95_04945, partial [Planctomycetota bacterium]|nr:hypothetical protein [Planctomycetota bacterium]